MKKYMNPELKIILISNADIVATSDPEDIEDDIIWDEVVNV